MLLFSLVDTKVSIKAKKDEENLATSTVCVITTKNLYLSLHLNEYLQLVRNTQYREYTCIYTAHTLDRKKTLICERPFSTKCIRGTCHPLFHII